MVYSSHNFPSSMKNLPNYTRNKAIEITNRLLKDGYEEGRAIAIGISQAKEWYENRGHKISSDITHHLVPYDNGWALKETESNEPAYTFITKVDAVNKLKELVKKYDYKIMIHDENRKFQRVY